MIWRGTSFFSQDAAVTYNHNAEDASAGSSGVSMWIIPRLAHSITSSVETRSRRPHWVRLKGTPSKGTAILNVYSPHTTRERCKLWNKLLFALSIDCRWVVTGDWNCVKHARDKSNVYGIVISREKQRMFTALKNTLQVKDNFPTANTVRYSWDNRRRNGNCTLTRLDRNNCFISPSDNTTGTEYEIHGDRIFSNHLGVWRRINHQPTPSCKSAHVMKAQILNTAEIPSTNLEHMASAPKSAFHWKASQMHKDVPQLLYHHSRRTKEGKEPAM